MVVSAVRGRRPITAGAALIVVLQTVTLKTVLTEETLNYSTPEFRLMLNVEFFSAIAIRAQNIMRQPSWVESHARIRLLKHSLHPVSI